MITSGIKQGCTGSATLFKLITYLIITELEKKGVGFVNQLFKIWILFFADDGLILAHSIEEAKNNIRILIDISKKCGLDINKEKSNIIICNMKEQPDSIEDIKVTDKIKYLGLDIDNKRTYFKSQKENILEKAQRLANVTYSVIAKSCNKVIIGKTYWKNLVLPSVLYGTNIINFNRDRNK